MKAVFKLLFLQSLIACVGFYSNPSFATSNNCGVDLSQLVRNFFNKTVYASYQSGFELSQKLRKTELENLDLRIFKIKEDLNTANELLQSMGQARSNPIPEELSVELIPENSLPPIQNINFTFQTEPGFENTTISEKIYRFHKKVNEHYFTIGLHDGINFDKLQIEQKTKLLEFYEHSLKEAEELLFSNNNSSPQNIALANPSENEIPNVLSMVIKPHRQNFTPPSKLRDLIGNRPKTNDFKKLSENTYYEFHFEREGSLLKNQTPQFISFDKKVLDWFKEPGLDEAKRKFIDQLLLGQASGGAGSLGLHPVKDGVYKLKIRTHGHWRIFLRRKSENQWFAFLVTDNDSYHPDSFIGLGH